MGTITKAMISDATGKRIVKALNDIANASGSSGQTNSDSQTQTSDARFKVELDEAIPALGDIPARVFRWKDRDGKHVGFFAQDVEAVAPYLVTEDAKGVKALDYIGVLVAKVAELERRVKAMEGSNHE